MTVADGTVLLEVGAQADSPELAQQIATVMSDEIIRMVKRLETPANSDVPAPIIARLASKASLNPEAVSPNIPLNVVTGLGLSLLAGIAGAVVRDLLDSTVKARDHVVSLTGAAPMVSLPFDQTVRDHPLASDDASGQLSEAFRSQPVNVIKLIFRQPSAERLAALEAYRLRRR